MYLRKNLNVCRAWPKNGVKNSFRQRSNDTLSHGQKMTLHEQKMSKYEQKLSLHEHKDFLHEQKILYMNKIYLNMNKRCLCMNKRCLNMNRRCHKHKNYWLVRPFTLVEDLFVLSQRFLLRELFVTLITLPVLTMLVNRLLVS